MQAANPDHAAVGWGALVRFLAPVALDLVVAAAIFAACLAIGYSLLPAAWRRRSRLAAPLALSLGLSTVGWTSWVAGSLVGTAAILPVVLVLLAQSARRWRSCVAAWSRWARVVWLLVRAHPILAAVTAGCLLLLLPQLLLPVTDSDGLRYHLALPKLYLLEGRVFHDPYDYAGALPQLAEMLYLVGLAVRGPQVAAFLHAGAFVAALAVLAATVHRGRASRAPAIVAALAFAATPVALAVAATAFVDQFAALHCAVALALAGAGAPPAAIGIALGGALGTKLTAAPFVAGLALVLLARTRRGGRWRAAAALVLPVAIVMAPFAIRNLARTGDPLFPLGHAALGLPIPGSSRERTRMSTEFHAGSPGFLGITWGESQGRAQADEVAGWHNLVALLALALAVRDRRARLLAAPVAAYLVLGLWFKPPTRLLLPMFLCLAGLAGLALARTRRRWPVWAGVALVAPAAVTAASFALTHRSPARLLLGRESRDAFMARNVPGWRAAQLVNAQPPGGRVMALDFPAPLCFDRPWIAEGLAVEPPLRAWVDEAASAAEVLARLRREDVRYLVVTPGYGGGTSRSLLPLATSPQAVRRVLGLRAALRLVGSADGVDVFAVPP